MRQFTFWALGTAFLIIATAVPAMARTTEVANANGNWSDSTTWTPALSGGPSGDYYVQWSSTTGYKVTYDVTSSREVNKLYMAGASGSELYFGTGAGTLLVDYMGPTGLTFASFGGAATQVYGTLTMDGGTLTMGTASGSGSWFGLGNTNAGAAGLYSTAAASQGIATINSTATLNVLGADYGIQMGSNIADSATVATLNVTGGTVNATTLQFMLSGTNTVNVSNSGILSLRNFSSYSGTKTGTYTLNLDGGTLQARAASTAFISGLTHAYIKDGGATVDTQTNNITIGQALEHNGIAATDGGLTKKGTGALTLSAANSYTGLTTVSAGALYVQNSGALGTTDTGTTVASGAQLALSNNVNVGNEALTLNGDGIDLTGALRNLAGNNTYGGAITLTSNTRVFSDAGTMTLNNTITGSGRVLIIGGGGNTTISGVIDTGVGSSFLIGYGDNTLYSLYKSSNSAGTLTLTNANTYTGATSNNGGTLLVNNTSGSGTGTGAVKINSGTLGGTGSIEGTVNIASLATLAPGSNGVGKLTLSGGLTVNNGGIYSWELGSLVDNNTSGAIAGADWDLLDLAGSSVTATNPTFAIAGSNIPSTDGFWKADHTWTVIANMGGLSSITGSAAVTGYDTSLGTFSAAASGSDMVLTWTAIPEPSAFALLVTGVIGLVAYAWRKRK